MVRNNQANIIARETLKELRSHQDLTDYHKTIDLLMRYANPHGLTGVNGFLKRLAEDNLSDYDKENIAKIHFNYKPDHLGIGKDSLATGIVAAAIAPTFPADTRGIAQAIAASLVLVGGTGMIKMRQQLRNIQDSKEFTDIVRDLQKHITPVVAAVAQDIEQYQGRG